MMCRRQRSYSPERSPYELLSDSLSFTSSGVTGRLLNTANNVAFQFELTVLEDNTFRLKINEASPIRARYEAPVGDVLVAEPKLQRLEPL
jgi:mannosyl-oligosaccharide alpha-1,3-glucosidase